MKVEKLGTEFDISIKDAIENVVDYEVYDGGQFRKVLDEKVIPYEGKLVEFVLDGGERVAFTPKHICKVRLHSGEDVLLYASDVEVGMKFLVNGSPVPVAGKGEVDYEGTVYGYETDGPALKPSKVTIVKEEYDDGSVEFVSSEN